MIRLSYYSSTSLLLRCDACLSGCEVVSFHCVSFIFYKFWRQCVCKMVSLSGENYVNINKVVSVGQLLVLSVNIVLFSYLLGEP